MSEPTRYPLAWPAGRPRTKRRQTGQFSMVVDGRTKSVSLATAADRLEDQITRLGGVYPLLSTNVETRMDGRPRADRGDPVDPGACVYFQLKGKPYTMACDTFSRVAQNIAALAAHIEATRRIERYGVATAAETLQAFSALPPPAAGPVAPVQRPWRTVLGFTAHFPDGLTPAEAGGVISARYRERAKGAAMDQATLAELNIARDAAVKELGQ